MPRRPPRHPVVAAAWWTAALSWAVVIFFASAQSSPDATFPWLLVPGVDKLLHAATYGLLALLLYAAGGRFGLALLLSVLYGASDELHQLRVAGRDASVYDWLADALGAGVTLGVVWFLTRRRPPPIDPVQ